jgi:predicted RNA polymerase sigma factor
LRLIAGLSTTEIARAFLTEEATVAPAIQADARLHPLSPYFVMR